MCKNPQNLLNKFKTHYETQIYVYDLKTWQQYQWKPLPCHDQNMYLKYTVEPQGCSWFSFDYENIVYQIPKGQAT